MYNEIKSSSVVPFGEPNHDKFLSDPIFYSVLLGLISSIVYYVTIINNSIFNDIYSPYYLYLIIYSFSILSCLISPAIIKLIKHRYSLCLSLIIMFIGYLISIKSYSNGLIIFGRFITEFSYQLSSITILIMLIYVFWESKYLNILFGLYFIIQQAFEISSLYITNYGIYNNLNVVGISALIIIAIIFTISLSQTKLIDSECTHSHVVSHQYIVSKESQLYYLIPMLLFLGFQSFIFSPIISTIAIIPITFIIHKWGRLKLFFVLMVLGVLTVISGFIIIYSNDYYIGPSSFYVGSSNFIKFLQYVNVIGYSTFIMGVTMIIPTMITTSQVFPKDNVLSIMAVLRATPMVGQILQSIIIKLISPWLSWYIAVALFIIGSIFFMLFLKVKGQNNICYHSIDK